MVMSCTFYAIPRAVTSAGSVRFFPEVSGNTLPIIAYDWDFGDGTAHGTDPTPIHAYPTVASYTTYDVTLEITDASGATVDRTITDYIAVDDSANVPAPPNDGTYQAVSVLMSDGTNQMLVNRTAWAGSNLCLLSPSSTDSLDKIGTFKFQLLDVGDSTAAEKTLIAEGVSVVVITGTEVTFSGITRRATQNTQNGFSSTSKVRLWDIECDSDLARLQKIKVADTSLPTYGETIIDSPGNIARRILS